jgi:hypothetical protein
MAIEQAANRIAMRVVEPGVEGAMNEPTIHK